MFAVAGFSTVWTPIAALNRTDADIILIWIDASGVVYKEPVDDPIFSAHSAPPPNSSIKDYYVSDYSAGVIGCAE
jgi:hypothetical protein